MLANELVSYRIAKELGLPTPDSFGYPRQGQEPVFVQFNFNGNGPLLPPVAEPELDIAVAEQPAVTALIVAFDILVMNTDRHLGNIAFRSTKSGDPLLVMYDHDRAVFGGPGHDPGTRRFKRMDWLGCVGKDPIRRQCLIDHLTDSNALAAAIDKLERLPDRVLTEAMLGARAFGLPAGESNQGDVGLRRRRDGFKKLLVNNRAEFKGIKQWTLEDET